MLVRSLAGHEKDRLYIIIRQDEGICMVSGWKKPDHGETQEKEEETYTGDP